MWNIITGLVSKPEWIVAAVVLVPIVGLIAWAVWKNWKKAWALEESEKQVQRTIKEHRDKVQELEKSVKKSAKRGEEWIKERQKDKSQ